MFFVCEGNTGYRVLGLFGLNNLVRLRLIYARTFSQLIQPMAQTCSIPVSIVLDITWLRGLEKSLLLDFVG